MANNCCIFDEIVIFRLILLSKYIFLPKKIAIRSGKSFFNYLIILDGNVLFEQILSLSKMARSRLNHFCTWLVLLDSSIYRWLPTCRKYCLLLFSLAPEISETTFLTLCKKDKNKWLIFSHNWFRKFLKPFPIFNGFKNFWNHFPKKSCVSNN